MAVTYDEAVKQADALMDSEADRLAAMAGRSAPNADDLNAAHEASDALMIELGYGDMINI